MAAERSTQIESVEKAEQMVYKRFLSTTTVNSKVLKLEYNSVDVNGKDRYHVELSHNFKTVLFADGKNRFLYRRKNKDGDTSFVGRRIPHLSKKFDVLTYEEDLNDEGYYVISAKDYDEKIRLYHSHRKNFKISQDWRLEKKSVRFFDLHVISEEKLGGIRETNVTLLGLD